MGGSYNLKALIKAIRSCKTLADERALIQKESAAIRTSFKEEDVFGRHTSVEKLLYIFMLGYQAHFGQIEALKLVASPRFADKKLGYLGIMLLLDENQELLTMVTNSLQADMHSSNMFIVGLSLCTFANIASEEMSRDLVNEIEKLLGSSNVYIKKKAALCAMRIIRRVPDLMDHFVKPATALLADRNHGVLLCGVSLVTEMCAMDPEVATAFARAVPMLVKLLKDLVTAGYSPEHDVSGITDPFLQVKVLRLMRILGTGDAQASEIMNDILAQVATNTESAKNVGNSILYEAVLTILDIDADDSLRVMAINILGKFLSNKDNNIRYVALNTLNKVVGIDTNAVQRHRSIILDCLRDGDISIRRRALELTYALINDQNVRLLTRELLAFLEVADAEFKLGMTTQIFLAAEKFAPNKRWHIDTVLRVLKLAGNSVREEVLASFIRLVAHTPELQGYTAQKLYSALKADVSQESLTLAAVWTIGEHGDILLQGGSFEDDEVQQDVSESDVVQLLESVLNSPYVNALTRQYVLMTAAKLTSRFAQGSAMQANLNSIMNRFEASVDIEAQQRAVEFAQLIANADEDTKNGVLERMPPPEIKATVLGTVSEKRAVGSTRRGKDTTLLDLMGDEGDSTPSVAPARQQAAQDLLADLFGDGAASQPAAAAATPTRPAASNDIMDLFDSAPEAAPEPPSVTAYEANGMRLTFTANRDVKQPTVTNITATFTSLEESLQGINLQAAVPKTQKLQMLQISAADIAAGSTAKQQLRVMAPEGSQVRLRLRIAFASSGVPHQEQVDFTLPQHIVQ